MSALDHAPGWLRTPLLRPRRKISRELFQMPDDGAATWTIDPPAEPPRIDILRVGNCEFREVEGAHTVTSGVGYPRIMAQVLAEHGVGMGFQNIFAWHVDDFPDRHTLLKRRRARRGAPDLVIVGISAYPAMRHVLGFDRRMIGLRENLGRRTGPLIFPIWRCISFVLLRVGRPLPWQGTDGVEAFVTMARDVWPAAQIAVQEPFMTQALPGAFDLERLARFRDDVRAAADRAGADWIPAPDLGDDPGLRGANGYNVNARGSRVAGEHYARCILDHGAIAGRATAGGA